MSASAQRLARAGVDAAILEATRRGVHVSVAVVDGGAHLVAFERMAGAVLASVETSQVKARTSSLFSAPTRVFPFDKPVVPALLGGVGYPVGLFPGGIPVLHGGTPIVALGVGGSSADDDEACALAGVAAIDALLAGEP